MRLYRVKYAHRTVLSMVPSRDRYQAVPRYRCGRVPIAAGSGNMIKFNNINYLLYSVYKETSLVCSRIVTSAAGTSNNTATDE